MDKRIWKFKLAGSGENIFHASVPAGSEILSGGRTEGEWCVWAMVNSAETERRDWEVLIAGTGHPISEAVRARKPRFLNTFFMPTDDEDRPLVFHAFDLGEAIG